MINKSDCNVSHYNVLHGSFTTYYKVYNGTQNFAKEFNGVMFHNMYNDLNITNIPWYLTNIQGGSVDSIKLCYDIISITSSVNKFKQGAVDNAAKTFLKEFSLKYL